MSINRNKVTRRFNAARHIVMGLILVGLAYPLVRYHKFGVIELSTVSSYTIAGIMLIYGLFRIWRGTRELRERDVDDFIS